MSGDIRQFLEEQKLHILEEKRRLGLLEKFTEENKENFNENTTKKEVGFDVDRAKLEEGEKKSSENDKTSQVFQRSDKEKGLDEGKVKISPSRHSETAKNESFQSKTVPSVVEPLDFPGCYDFHVGKRKQALIDKLVNSEYPFSSRSDGGVGRRFDGGGSPFDPPMLRRGDYAPSTTLRASPHEGLGEYELRRGILKERREREYLRQLAKNNEGSVLEVEGQNLESPKNSRSTNTELSLESKLVQTDIQNINNRLVQYDLVPEKEVTTPRTVTDELVDAALRRRGGPYRVDQRLTTAQNEFVLRASTSGTATMDKPKSILSNRRTGSPRDRYEYPSDVPHSSYASSSFMDGFSYSDRSDDLERERLKRETYQRELRLQIDEKRHLAAMREEQERRERELENKRIEQQLLRMQEEQAIEEQRRAKRNELMRRHSDDLLRRKTELHEMQRPWRRHADSESCNLDSLGLGMTSSSYGGGPLGGAYSPPVSRRALSSYTSYNVPATSVFADTSSSSRYNPHRYESSSSTYGGILRKEPLRRMESLNSYDTVPLRGHRRFDRFDSLSRIDSLTNRLETMSVRDGDLSDVQRRHSATQQDLSLLRKSPRLRRRNSSSRFEDSLPVPMLKARSPVAKELKNAVPFSSQRGGSEAMRRLEDRWQVPAVQKNIVHTMESPSRGSILTQLGSIRAQLQREQLRMDETLRRRGLVRQRTTEDY